MDLTADIINLMRELTKEKALLVHEHGQDKKTTKNYTCTLLNGIVYLQNTIPFTENLQQWALTFLENYFENMFRCPVCNEWTIHHDCCH